MAKISSLVTLVYPVKNASTYLFTDASVIAVGAVLHRKINGDLRPLGFFSRAFNNAQLKNSVFDKELTALHMAVNHFKYFLNENSKLSILPILFTYLVPLTLSPIVSSQRNAMSCLNPTELATSQLFHKQ